MDAIGFVLAFLFTLVLVVLVVVVLGVLGQVVGALWP